MTIWIPLIEKGNGPLYKSLADAIERDVRSGRLTPGARLPTHRDLADALAVNVSTVTRGYAEAERRGLIHATVGRGTFVTSDGGASPSLVVPESHVPVLVEMDLVTPLYALDPDIGEGLRRLSTRRDLSRLLRYAAPAGLPEHRAAGAEWMSRYGLETGAENVVVTAGGQHALACCLTALFRPGQRMAVDVLTYPGIKSLAASLGIRLAPVAGDGQGMSAADLDAACRREDIAGVYLMPGVHNPTTTFMTPVRRDEIAAVVRRYGLVVLEDDAYGLTRLHGPEGVPVPVSVRVPEQSVFIAGVSKAFGAGLRVAFLSAPDPFRAKLAEAVLNTVWMASPITTELASAWIMDGVADAAVAAKQEEARRRYAVAAGRLTGYEFQGHETGFFLWLRLPEPWTGAALELRAREAGVKIFGAERFSVGHEPAPPAVRISLAGPESAERLAEGLDVVRRVLEGRVPDVGARL